MSADPAQVATGRRNEGIPSGHMTPVRSRETSSERFRYTLPPHFRYISPPTHRRDFLSAPKKPKPCGIFLEGFRQLQSVGTSSIKKPGVADDRIGWEAQKLEMR